MTRWDELEPPCVVFARYARHANSKADVVAAAEILAEISPHAAVGHGGAAQRELRSGRLTTTLRG